MTDQVKADDAPLHYYALTFSGSLPQGRANGSTYWGWAEPQVNLPRIEQARRSLGFADDAVLMACCYLGLMTPAQMRGDAPLSN